MELWTNWLYQTGWKVFTILGICLGAFFIIRRLAPIAIRRAVKRQMKGKRKAEREKRVQTLVRVVTTVSGIGLGTLATLLILGQVGVNIWALASRQVVLRRCYVLPAGSGKPSG